MSMIWMIWMTPRAHLPIYPLPITHLPQSHNATPLHPMLMQMMQMMQRMQIAVHGIAVAFCPSLLVYIVRCTGET